MALTTSPSSLDMFLQSLLNRGRIDETEYTTAMSLAHQDEKRQRQIQIPGAVVLNYEALPPNQLATTSAVFNTVELIEIIFSHLSNRDLIKGVSLTCHGFRNIVNATPALRRQLFLQADKTSAFRVPAIRNVHYTVIKGYVEITIINTGELLYSSRILRSMLLIQPPIMSGQIFYNCLCRARDAGNIFVEDGLTFGHVAARLSACWTRGKAGQDSYYQPCQCSAVVEARLTFRRNLT